MRNEEIKNNGEFVSILNHNLHILRIGNESKPKLIFMSGSGTVSPIYDFKILYSKLLNDFRIIVIEKFGYGYSDLYESPCDVDSLVNIQREALHLIGEKGPYILAPHSMSGLEAIRWKQKYPDEVIAFVGIDMATPITYLEWSEVVINKKIDYMQKAKKLHDMGLLFWYPLNTRGLNKKEKKQQRFLWKRNGMNDCFINEARQVLNNAKIVESGGRIECNALLFVSDGKQVSSNWIGDQQKFATEIKAELVQLKCGHYVHHFESDLMKDRIIDFFINRKKPE